MHRYRALLALPGARAPMLLSIAGSMPIGMFGLAILLLVRDATGSFAEAGRVLGAFSIANACGAVAQGRLMDRLGQGPVLRTVASLHLPALIALVIAAHEHAPAGVLFLFALCGGATLAQLPAAMRSLWTTLAESDAQRETAYAVVTIAFEVAVVTAPAIVAGIVAVASPAAAVVIGGDARHRLGAGVHASPAPRAAGGASGTRWAGSARSSRRACGRCSSC